MANVPIWPGSSSFFPGDTPFGFYDNQYDFQVDADKVAKFCAIRLGYPIENVELQAVNFYTAFEEATTVYGNELYAYQLRDNYLSLEGVTQSIDVNDSIITPSMANIVRLSQQYGEEAGAGGNVTWLKGQLMLTASVQQYDLKAWAIENGISGGIEIKNVWYQPPPAINQLYSPYMLGQGGGAGLGGVPAAGVYGFGYGYSNYLMMPTSYTMQNLQAIEMQNTVTLSNYTFNIINNIITVFPVPGTGMGDGDFDGADGLGYGEILVFDFIKVEDRLNSAVTNGIGKISNASNVPYTNPNYNDINSVGRSWIFEYTLALSKEMLGYTRNKYSSIPIPGAEVTLNGDTLVTAATTEKENLITRLREYFDSTSRQALLERRSAESTARQNELNQSPMTIFIG
jgi:hypothetical protein